MSEEPFPSWSALATVYQSVLHDVVAALDEAAGIDSGVFSVLAYLDRAVPPHRMAMAELQRAMHPRYSQPGFSRLVQRMEATGLVDRRADRDDRRASVVVTTRRGRAQFARANEVYVEALREAFAQYARTDEHAALMRVLTAISARRAERSDRDLG
jgi:DNA-binding MarR family transcriptional regulator